jgi:molybdopterin converting factor small subunit
MKGGEGTGLMEVKVTVKYSHYRKYLDDQAFPSVTLAGGATVKDLVEELGVPGYYLKEVTVNGEVKELDTVLSDGDTVVIWPPRIGGG